MKKIIKFLIIFSVLLNSFFVPTIHAEKLESNTISYSDFKITKNQTEIKVENIKTGEWAHLNLITNVLINEKGQVFHFSKNNTGAYLNGDKIVDIDNATFRNGNSRIINDTWIPLSTRRYRKGSEMGWTVFFAGIASFAPGFIGNFFSVTSLIFSLSALNSDDVYIELKQYYNPSNYSMIKEEMSFYRNANYTGLITRRTYFTPLEI